MEPLNRCVYGRDNPERCEDLGGHMPITPNGLDIVGVGVFLGLGFEGRVRRLSW